MATVADEYPMICEDQLYTRAHESEYWQSCLNFWTDVKDKHIGQLSYKQVSWLDSIDEKILED